MIRIRGANLTDVSAMSRVLTASITFLCTDDHLNEPRRLQQWTRNKTVEGVGKMLDNESLTMLVAEVSDDVAAVGAVVDDNILLNYVAPEYRFRGVSKALLNAMEELLRNRGVSRGKLVSTKTGLRIYLSAGWSALGSGDGGILMEKPFD